MREQLRLVAKLQEMDHLLHRLGHALEDLRNEGLSDDEIRAISMELEQIATGKDEMKDKIKRDLLVHYQRFYQRHNLNAVSKMLGGVCQSCHVTVPSGRALLVRRGETLEFCENCGAILIYEEEKQAPPAGRGGSA
ncbi:MAG TPA: C4-type zinc ribbon domain-containing protein [bacterium]|nr:C4-type zinc ribbon domain-containing protein [bacterium]